MANKLEVANKLKQKWQEPFSYEELTHIYMAFIKYKWSPRHIAYSSRREAYFKFRYWYLKHNAGEI